jgi:hypothetical protein
MVPCLNENEILAMVYASSPYMRSLAWWVTFCKGGSISQHPSVTRYSVSSWAWKLNNITQWEHNLRWNLFSIYLSSSVAHSTYMCDVTTVCEALPRIWSLVLHPCVLDSKLQIIWSVDN